MKKICILIPYYGKWPSFLPIYLKSCSFNPSISILFFTDLLPPTVYPSNVYFHSLSLSKIKVRLDYLLGFDSAISTPYKLCDVRPAYGLIFKEYIANFDFWGWGDIDLIYGRLDRYITSEVLKDNDVISFRRRWLSGSLCLIKNNNVLNNLFLHAEDLRSIFTSPTYKGFDEISKCWNQISTNEFDEVQWPHDNFTRLLKKAESVGEVCLYFNDFVKESIPSSDFLIWNNGDLRDNHGRYYSHYHFITEKRKPYFVYPNGQVVKETYYVDKAGFYSEKEFNNHCLIRCIRIASATPNLILTYVSNKILALKGRIYRNNT